MSLEIFGLVIFFYNEIQFDLLIMVSMIDFNVFHNHSSNKS